ALADDLLRYLEFRPIQQRPSGFGLRLMRWSQRHRTLAVGAAAAIVLAIVLPTAIAIERSHALAQVSDERDRYERAVTGVVDILGRAQPLLDDVAELDGGETGEAVRELFRRMTDFYGELRRFDAARPAIRDALVQAQYHEALLLTDLGEFEQADALADALLGIVGEDDQHRRLRYELRVARGQVLENRGEYPAAEAELRAAIAEIDRLPQASVDDRMRAGRARVTIAILLSRRFSEGLVAAAQDAVTAFEEIVAQEPGNVDAQSYLAHARRLSAQVLSRSGNEERALELLQRTRADLQDRLVAHRRDRKLRIELAKTEQVIAEEHRLAGRHEAALPHLRAAVAARRDFLQIWPNRPTVAGHLADSLSDLGSSLNLVERPEEARGALEEAKALLEEQLARDAELEVFERQLAVVCMELGKAMAATSGLGPESHAMSEHAVELIDGVIARQENVLPDYYAERAMARAGCGQSHFNLGRARPALELLLGARDDLQRYLAEASEDGSMKRQLGQICLVTSLVAAKVEEIDTVEELLRQADELIGFDASDVTFLAPLLGDERAAAILQRLGK
ncbi:MAG: hypothetical protein KDE27_04025, partial [Planctomycetes bacterium]|nr:hypothetical protein [Planctomycetota bacterium]